MKRLIFGVSLTAVAALVQTAQAADDLTIPENTEVAYGAETVDVGKIVYTSGGTYVGNASKGWLTLNGTTMTATGISTPGGADGNKWINGYITLTNGASLTVSSAVSILNTMYGTQWGDITLKDKDSSMSVDGSMTLGCGTHNMSRVHTRLRLSDGASFDSKSLSFYGYADLQSADSTVRVKGDLSFGRRTSYGYASYTGGTGFTNKVSLVRSATSVSGGMTLGEYVQTEAEIVGGSLAVGGGLSLMTAAYQPFQTFPSAALSVSGGADVSVTGTVSIANIGQLHADVSLAPDTTFYAGALVVGKAGIGTFSADQVPFTVVNAMTVASDATAVGTADAANATFSVGSLVVGGSGQGTLNAADSEITSSGVVTVGSASGSTGLFDLGAGTLSAASLTVGASGTGTLVATGATVTASGAVTIGSASGSSGRFDLGAGTLAATSLTVGNSGTGTLDATGATVTVSGAVAIGAAGVLDIGNGTLSVGSLTGNGGTSTLKLDGATIRFLSDGALFTGLATVESSAKTVTVDVNGHAVTLGQAPAGCKLHFTGQGTVVIPSGVTPTDYTFDRTVKFSWADRGPTTTITQTEGTVTDTDAHAVAGNETLRFDIASGASRTASGKIGIGSLEKVGGGYLKLTNAEDYFSDVFLGGGTLALGADMPEDTMSVFTLSNKANLVVIENDAKQVASFPTRDNFKYAFLKRGAGELVLEKAVTAYDYNYTPSAPIVTSANFDKTKPLDFSDPSVLPTENFMPLNVAEGKLTIRGTSEGQTRLAFQASVAVGVPVTTCAAQPEMVIENTAFEMSGQNYFQLGPANVAGSSAVVSPRLTVINSTLYPHTLAVNNCYGRGSNKDLCSHVYFTNSTLKTSWNIMPNGAYNSGGSAFSELQFVDSAAHSSNVTLMDPFRMTFDHSVLDGWNANSIKFIAYGNSTNLMVFANGSKFYFDGTNYDLSNSGNLTKRHEWVFDDSEWILAKTDSDRTYHVNDRVNVVCVMRGRGLVVKPGAGFTYTINEPLTGDGGFVNAGAGTAVLKNGMVGYKGVTRAELSTSVIDFDGASLTNVTLAGAGSFQNGTLVTPKVLADGSAPLLDNVTLDGKVTVVFGDTVPVIGTTIDVARYSGSLANWKVKRTKDFGVTLSKDGTLVKAKITQPPGLLLIVR